MSIPSDSKERKDVPVFSGFMAYFPDAIAEVARLSQAGNDKHNPGEPLHWSRDKSSDHGDCIARHQLEFDSMDDDGFLHAAKVAWRAMAQLQLLVEPPQRVFGMGEPLQEGGTRDYFMENPEALSNPFVSGPVCSPCVAEPWAGTRLPNPKKHKDIYDECLERGYLDKGEDADDYCRVCLERLDRCMCHAEGYNGA